MITKETATDRTRETLVAQEFELLFPKICGYQKDMVTHYFKSDQSYYLKKIESEYSKLDYCILGSVDNDRIFGFVEIKTANHDHGIFDNWFVSLEKVRYLWEQSIFQLGQVFIIVIRWHNALGYYVIDDRVRTLPVSLAGWNNPRCREDQEPVIRIPLDCINILATDMESLDVRMV